MKLRILKSAVTNPWFNLATEDWIFNTLNPDSHTLFLWRNSETVVIGRSQNPWVECKTDKMEADDVFLARRQSGGGAVFHDLGNTNFTFFYHPVMLTTKKQTSPSSLMRLRNSA